MADAALLEAVPRKRFAFRCVIFFGSPFNGKGHRKVWARLRIGGIRTSRHRVLRLMKQHGLLAPARASSPKGPRHRGGNAVSRRDGTIIPDRVDAMWGTNPARNCVSAVTTTWTGEGQAAVLVAVDHHSAECVGIRAACRATRFEALEPMRQGVRRCFGAFGKEIAQGLAVRHDHGSQYI